MSNLNFDNLFGNASFDFHCPKCNFKIQLKMNQVGSTITCPGCKANITLKKDSSYQKSVNEIDKGLNDLSNTINNFGK